MERLKSIDGLKGLCMILIAFFCHYSKFWDELGFDIANYLGYCAELFFICSGFTIAYNYRNKTIDFESYFLKKYLRIMPLYWTTSIIFYIAYAIAESILQVKLNVKIDVLKMCLDMTGCYSGWIYPDLPINGALWTVNILFLLYIIYFLIKKISKDNNLIYICLVTLLILIGIIGEKRDFNVPFLYSNSCGGYIAFGCGLLLYEIFIHRVNILKCFGCFTLMLIIARGIYAKATGNVFIYDYNLEMFILIIVCPMVFSLAMSSQLIKRVLESKLLQKAGCYSFSVYMWHFLIREVLIATRYNDTLIGLVVYVIITIIIATISKKIFEPILQILINKIGEVL